MHFNAPLITAASEDKFQWLRSGPGLPRQKQRVPALVLESAEPGKM